MTTISFAGGGEWWTKHVHFQCNPSYIYFVAEEWKSNVTPDIFPFHQCCTLLLFFDKCSDCLRINQPLPASSSSRGKQLQRRKFPYLRYFYLSLSQLSDLWWLSAHNTIFVNLNSILKWHIYDTFHLFLSQLSDLWWLCVPFDCYSRPQGRNYTCQ